MKYDDDGLPRWALERLPRRRLTATDYRRRDLFIEVYNGLTSQYGRAIADLMIGHSISPLRMRAVLDLIQADLEFWEVATGERVQHLGLARHLALEACRWEMHDRRQHVDWKPNKSATHDRPWPAPELSPLARWIVHGGFADFVNTTSPVIFVPNKGLAGTVHDAAALLGGHSKHAPRKWSPRRWFGPGQPAPPLTISISRALSGERAGIRAALATEVASEEFYMTAGGEWRNTSVAPIAERNHPKPKGFWGPEGGFWGPEAEGFYYWMKETTRQLHKPRTNNRRVYEKEVDEQPPESVLLQVHEPASGEWVDSSPLDLESYVDRLRLDIARPRQFYDQRYWTIEDGGVVLVGERCPAQSYYHLPSADYVVQGTWPPPPPQFEVEWWKTKPRPRYRYWDRHNIDVSEGRRWLTTPRRPNGAPYTIDLIWKRRPQRDPGVSLTVVEYDGKYHVLRTRVVAPASFTAPRRTAIGTRAQHHIVKEVLRSPYFPRGFVVWRPNKDAKGWAATVPDKRPGEWAREHVESPAYVLSEKRKECERRREAAICGLLSNFGCV